MKRTVLITGGHGDIGGAIASLFEAKGDHVIAPGSRELDLTSSDSIQSFFDGLKTPVDVFVHSAGFNNPKPFDEIKPEDLHKTLAINTLGFFWAVQRLSPSWIERRAGHVLAISSIYGSFSRVKRLSYATAKHGLSGMVKTLALELGPHGVIVNSLSPGFVDTKMTHKNNDAKTIQSFERRTALRRLALPSDIAEVAHFLCSPQNRYLHGQDVIVDGGYSIGGFQDS